MRTLNTAIVAATASLLTACGPDLAVSSLQLSGSPTVNANNAVEVPIHVVVTNQGNRSASLFKVSTQYTDGAIDPARKFTVAFTVPGQTSIWYPSTMAPLAAGAQAAFNGTVTFHPNEHGVTVRLTALADSCSGDEFMPAYCRVRERNEGNNESAPISIALP